MKVCDKCKEPIEEGEYLELCEECRRDAYNFLIHKPHHCPCCNHTMFLLEDGSWTHDLKKSIVEGITRKKRCEK